MPWNNNMFAQTGVMSNPWSNNNSGYPSNYSNYNYNSSFSANSNNVNANSSNIIWVSGMEGAKAYQMGANSSVVLLDNTDENLFVKTTDGAGFPNIRVFRLEGIDNGNTGNVSINNNVNGTGVDFITRQEFEDFKQEVGNYAQQIISNAQPVQSTQQSSIQQSSVSGTNANTTANATKFDSSKRYK